MSQPSYGSVLTCIVFGSILMLYLILVSKRKKFILGLGPKCIIISMMFVIIRMFFPFNFAFTHNIESKKYLAYFFNLLRHPFVSNIEIMDVMIYGSFVGFILSFLLLIWRRYRFYQLIHIYPYNESSLLKNIITEICVNHKNQPNFKIIVLPIIHSPCITGLFHPIILLPEVNFTDEELKFVLSHEIEHYYHHDLWYKLICELIVCLYWWNPLVHWLNKQLSDTIEHSNDLAISETIAEDKQLSYIECLIKIAKNKPALSPMSALFFSQTSQNTLSKRADYILERPRILKNKAYHLFHILIIVGFLFTSLFFAFEPSYPNPTHAKGEEILGLEKESTFFVRTNTSKQYDVYYKGHKYPTISIDNIKSSFSGYRIYNSMTEAKEHEKIN
ncbi:MAG: M56 family metallopeptidase [Anaerostipes sp.]|nr:M56 family metallopeptidase [Anaerostipes sp.]